MSRVTEIGLGSGGTKANNEVYLLYGVRDGNHLLLPKPTGSCAWQKFGARIW